MKKVLKIVTGIVLLILGICAIFVLLNFTYLKRTFTGQSSEQVRDISWYEPKFEMQASDAATPLRRANADQPDKFSDAIDYAESTNSSAFLIWHKGQLVSENYWQPYNSTSYTQTHSIHKSLLGMAVGIALEEGHIDSLDAPVSDYLGQWIDQPYGEITLKHLLNMSSGLGETSESFFLFSHFLRLLNDTDISGVAQSLPQKVAPGTEFEYINNNPQLMLDVLEVATGVPYEQYLEEKVWSKMAENPGYLWMDREGGTPHGYCCLMALPEDLLRIGLLILNKGRLNGEQIVPAHWIDKMLTPSALNPNYGYQVWLGNEHQPLRKYNPSSDFGVLHSEPYIADDVVFFDGFGGQRVYIVPSQELVIVRVGEMRMDFDDAILPNRVMESLNQGSATDDLFEVTYEDLSFETEHSGPISVRVSYPVDATGTQPFILFSHGHYLNNKDYHALTDQWVERGYVVAAPLHLDSGTYEYVGEISAKYGGDWVAAARPLDMLSILNQTDQLLELLQGFEGSIRTDKVIAAGHSFGALSAQWTGGATLEPHAWSIYPIPDVLSDPRVVAIVAISPPGLYPDHFSEATWETLSTPQFVVTGTQDKFDTGWTDYREHFASYNIAEPGDNYLFVLDEVDHYFGNLIGRLNLDAEPQQDALNRVADMSLLFMDSYLHLNEEAKEQLNDVSTISALPGVNQYETR